MGPIELQIDKLFQDPPGPEGKTGMSGLFELVLDGTRRAGELGAGELVAEWRSDRDYDIAPHAHDDPRPHSDFRPVDFECLERRGRHSIVTTEVATRAPSIRMGNSKFRKKLSGTSLSGSKSSCRKRYGPSLRIRTP